MHLWELDDNGKTNHLVFDHEIEYYVKIKLEKVQLRVLMVYQLSKNFCK